MNEKPKVICLGLSRTGTSTLKEALGMLGFGPCYHMTVILDDGNRNPAEIDTWLNLGQGKATLDDIRTLLKDYNSILDIPAAIYIEELYKAYPNAKFILTTRDPAKWEVSMKNTVLDVIERLSNMNPDKRTFFQSRLLEWYNVEMLTRYHQGKIFTDTQGELIAHNERVMKIIPSNKLLVYEVSQGWEPLVDFLEVEKPDMPFPHMNVTVEFQKRFVGSPKEMK
ncbi:hypothetical protein Clacol_010415 [Clathrus columnatus]|uniref:Sulfotransferase family protein n=1 Tax=Clathrus columnatus TaxID=1419009 RepID=A0AAV5AW63_9AGAM|nr:hypothetical protein Clacol_010415 [Clathrus columnatus]